MLSAAAIVSCAWLAASSVQYRFVPEPGRLVGHTSNSGLHIGRLDERGVFHQASFQAFPDPASPIPTLFYSGEPLGSYRPARQPGRKVYQFQSGMLVPGVVSPDFEFVPEPGAAVLALADYKVSPFARPIWNLPGHFEPVNGWPERKPKGVRRRS